MLWLCDTTLNCSIAAEVEVDKMRHTRGKVSLIANTPSLRVRPCLHRRTEHRRHHPSAPSKRIVVYGDTEKKISFPPRTTRLKRERVAEGTSSDCLSNPLI